MKRKLPATATAAERIEHHSMPEPNSGCWIWLKSLKTTGYGHLTYKQQTYAGHRLSWEAFKGPIPAGLQVLHCCDNRVCVNPDHLFLGTGADNMADMIAKGRAKHERGENASRTVLTERDVLEIRASSLPDTHLAARYGVGSATIYAVRQRLSWKHI